MELGTLIGKGNTAQIYLNGNKVIKVFHDFVSNKEATYEANKQKYAYSCGLSVPKIIDVVKIEGKQAIIMEYVKGRTLGELLSESLDKAEYFMMMSIDIQHHIHRVIPSPNHLESMSEKLKRQLEGAQQLNQRQKSVLMKQLDPITYKHRLCHGDYHLYNLIMSDNNEVTIIDWVDASSGDFRADVYRTYLLYTQFSKKIADMYLHMYCAKSGLSTEEVLQWAPIIAGARLSENVSTENNQRLLEIVNQHCP